MNSLSCGVVFKLDEVVLPHCIERVLYNLLLVMRNNSAFFKYFF